MVLVVGLCTKTLFVVLSFGKLASLIFNVPDIIKDALLPEISALPVNCPLNVPCKVDKFDTDADTDVNELDIFCNISKFASISCIVRGAPLISLLIIAILY